jgi:hypothetical protein
VLCLPKAALRRQLAIPPHFLRASYVERFTTCGKTNCACAQGQKHGPFYYRHRSLDKDMPGRAPQEHRPDKKANPCLNQKSNPCCEIAAKQFASLTSRTSLN